MIISKAALPLAVLSLFLQPAVAQDCQGKAIGKAQVAANDHDVVDVAVAAGKFKTLVAAVKAAGLEAALRGNGPFTVFAPTDDAFAKLPTGTVETLLKPENKAKLAAILTYHVVPGKVMAAEVVKTTGALSLQGQRLSFRAGEGVMVDRANVVSTDIAAKNGVIHVIDQVIMPTDKNLVEVATAAGKFGTLLAAAKAAGLADTLATGGPFTVFAPTDEAFAKLPKGTVESLLEPANKSKLADILKLHVISGRVDSSGAASAKQAKSLQGGALEFAPRDQGLSVNGASIVGADVNASNGLIHVIDTVLIPR